VPPLPPSPTPSGGAKVGPAGARALAVKTCAPAVGWSLGGESKDSSSQLTAKNVI